jgi:hypothetical protein
MSIFVLSSASQSQKRKAQKAIERLVNTARSSDGRRREQRYPFFRAVTILVGREELPAFAREISLSGLGLLHHAPLERGELIVAIPEAGHRVHLRTEIVWCQPCGHGSYISGGCFVDVDRELLAEPFEGFGM